MNAACEMHPWLQRGNQPALGQCRLYCFPPAGASSAFFSPWLGLRNAGFEVCAVRLPGRERRAAECPMELMGPLVQSLVEGLPWDRPFAFFGHSLGALISFELARELRRRNWRQPKAIFASAAPAPQLPLRPPRYQLPHDLFVHELRELGGTTEAVLLDKALMEHFMPVLRADFALVDTYKYAEEAPLECPIVALGGRGDQEVSPKALAQWQSVAHKFTLQLYPGDHFYVLDHWASILQLISNVLV